MSPTQKQERWAAGVVASLLCAFIVTLPYADRELARHDAFIPIVDTILFLNDLITAALLYAHVSVTRSRRLLALATGYLSTALIIVPHLMTFPGAFSESGLLGGSLQSTVWLYIVWHLGLPPAAIVYALMKDRPAKDGAGRLSVRAFILVSILMVVLVVCALTWLFTAGADLLPPIMVDRVRANAAWQNVGAPIILALSLTAIITVWRRRASVLDLWLLVVLWAWFVETLLLSLTDSRYSLVWYAGRSVGLLSSCFVLLVLLSEATTLYVRLALTAAERAQEREGQRMTLEVVVQSISHELRQPLSAIVANGEATVLVLSKDGPDTDEARAAVRDIISDAHRAVEVLTSTKALLTGSRQSTVLVPIDEVVRDAVRLMRLQLQTHEIALRLSTAADVPPVRGHVGQLRQALINLITNAVESMAAVTDRSRVLTIHCKPTGAAKVLILVEDSGIGLDADAAARIYQPFFTTKPKGTGLGLAICRWIVEGHGGRLWHLPGRDHGLAVCIELPAASSNRQEQGGSAA